MSFGASLYGAKYLSLHFVLLAFLFFFSERNRLRTRRKNLEFKCEKKTKLKLFVRIIASEVSEAVARARLKFTDKDFCILEFDIFSQATQLDLDSGCELTSLNGMMMTVGSLASDRNEFLSLQIAWLVQDRRSRKLH
jgi:hypothetical protein